MRRYANWLIDPKLVSTVRQFVSQYECKCHIHHAGISQNLLSEIHHTTFFVKCYKSLRCISQSSACGVYLSFGMPSLKTTIDFLFTPQGPVPFIDRFMDQRFQFLTDKVPHRVNMSLYWTCLILILLLSLFNYLWSN